jgi:uncharacterized protein YegL
LRWGAAACGPRQPEAVLQVGLATTHYRIDKTKIPPLNLCLVIDESGSMQGERIENVKQALLAFVDQLRAVDRVCIVGFSDDARVVLPSQCPPNHEEIRAAIAGIDATMSTNLHAGLMLGFEQVAAHYEKGRTNRVILLTDGNANRGVTDPEQTVQESQVFNDKDIDLSTIGVGYDLNHRLLRSLAKAGRGLLHFVGDDKDIAKTFVEELDSLLSPVARRIAVEIECDDALRFERMHGYEPKVDGQRITLSLEDLNHGATQVILLRMRTSADLTKPQELGVKVRLKYFDVARRESLQVDRRTTVSFQPDLKADAPPLAEPTVRKHVTIAEMAEGIRAMAEVVADEKLDQPEKLDKSLAALDAGLAVATTRYSPVDDPDLVRMQEILTKYRKPLEEEKLELKRGAGALAVP